MNSEQSALEVAASEDTSQRDGSDQPRMGTLQFESWISDHYEDLLTESRKVCRKYHQGDNHQEMLHAAIDALLDGHGEMPPTRESAMGWVMTGVKLKLMQHGTLSDNKANLEARFAGQLEVLGDDVFYDTTGPDHMKASDARRKREKRAEAKRPAQDDLSLYGLNIQVDGFLRDGVRWRRQQMRDGRLFDERAVRSLAESMHRASQRYRHMGEHGFSFTEFGQEVAR